MFKRKKKHNQQLIVGVRTQLCEKCQDFKRRLCEVDGEPAFFHRWVDEEQALLHINVFVRDEDAIAIHEKFMRSHVVPHCCSTTTVRNVWALVEFPDGAVRKVAPDKVRFLDKEGGAGNG